MTFRLTEEQEDVVRLVRKVAAQEIAPRARELDEKAAFPEHARKIDAMIGWKKIVNLYTSWLWQLAGILERLGMRSIAELRGRSDVLVYLE